MFSPRPAFASLVAILALLDGCSGSDGKGSSPSGATNVCGLDTGWEGDENCILPPPADVGFQIHVGPTDYDDPDDVASYLLAPDLETVECYNLVAPNDHGMFNRKREYRMRPGTHHLILKNGDGSTGWGQCPPALQSSWGGSQTKVNDVGFADPAPEDANYATYIEQNKPTAAELHYYNTGDTEVLREIWVNFYEADPNVQWQQLNGIALVGFTGLQVAPYEHRIIRWSADNTEARRVVYAQGHVHSHNKRLSAWRVTPADERTLIYEQTRWDEPAGLRYNTITTNPAPGSGATEAGVSGLLELNAGDRIEWECDIENDLPTTLVFANEALTAEMCILFGSTPQTGWATIPPVMLPPAPISSEVVP